MCAGVRTRKCVGLPSFCVQSRHGDAQGLSRPLSPLVGPSIPSTKARLGKRVLVSTMELLLNCSTRFYDRQFNTCTNLHKDHVAKFHDMLQAHRHHEKHLVSGIPTVAECGDHMGKSRTYLSDLLKEETRTSSSTPTTRWAKSPTASGSSTLSISAGYSRPKRA